MKIDQYSPLLGNHDSARRVFIASRAQIIQPHISGQSFTQPEVFQLLQRLDPRFPPLQSKLQNVVCRYICRYLVSGFGLNWIKQPMNSVQERDSDISKLDRIKARTLKTNTKVTQNKPTSPSFIVLPPNLRRLRNPSCPPQISRKLFAGVIDRIARMLSSSSSSSSMSSADVTPVEKLIDDRDRTEKSISKPKLSEFNLWAADHNALKNIASSPKTTWVFDCEFVNLSKGMCAIPFEISIRTLDRALIVNTCVDYKMSTLQLYTQLVPWLQTSTDTPVTYRISMSCENSILKHYGSIGSQLTPGKTIAQIRQAILQQGWDPNTHRLLNWGGASVDRYVFNRIMAGNDDPVVPYAANLLSPYFDVIEIAKKVLGSGYQGGLSLGELHKSLCGEIYRKYHRADDDVQAMIDVIESLLAADQ